MGRKVVFLMCCVLLIGLTFAGPLRAELVGWWTFDEGTGITASDSSGYDNHGTLMDNVQWAAVGKMGGAAELDGASGHIEVPFSESLRLLNQGDFTISAWCRLNAVPPSTNRMVVQQGDRNGAGRTLLFVASTNEVRSYAGNATSGSGVGVEAGVWAHLAVVVTEGGATDSVQLYVNGEAAGGPTEQSMENSEGDYFIGSHKNLNNVWDGLLDEVRIYNHAMSPPELRTAMQGEPYPFAITTEPQNGVVLDQRVVTLKWVAGELATSHLVYFGESYEAVNEGLVEPVSTTDESLMLGVAEPHVTGLTPGQTYYWRVDEVSDAHPDSPWKGEVQSFRVRPAIAWNPTPADEIEFVHQDQDLSWEPGLGVLFHTLYFGESFDEVNDATSGGAMIVETTRDPGPLDTARTYYWRVDEFDGMQTYKGEVWSFTTVSEIAVTDPNLTVWWTLDEGNGATAVDWSGHGYHGVVHGDAQWADGYQGTALTFTDDAYVEAANHPGIIGTAPRTSCAWIRTATANRNIMSWGQNVAGQKWRMRLDATGGLRVEVNGGYHYGVTNLADGRWHHVAITFADDGSPDVLDTLLYVDGRLNATAASQDEPIDTVAGPVRIGESPWHNAPFIGEIDDARIYDKVLSEEEIQEVMRGNPLLAGDPDPDRGAILDIRDIRSLSWSPGDTSVSHDVYFGTDGNAVRAADKEAAEFHGNQAGTNFSLAGLVELGGGDYYWRIDEVESDGTVHSGDLWEFTIPDYLIVDDFESYDDDIDAGTTIFDTWIDGWTNGTGSQVGYLEAPFAEQGIVNSGAQSMPLVYNNVAAPGSSEADRTLDPAEDWTAQGVTTLLVHFHGTADNTGQLYVKINGTKVLYDGDPADIAAAKWTPWPIDLAAVGGNLTSVTTLTIGVEGGETGTLYVDDIRLTKP